MELVVPPSMIHGHSLYQACDIDKYCREVYKLNYGVEPVEDVKKMNPKEMEDFDIICGGFPCQAFSNGKRKLSKMIEVYYLTKLLD